MKGARLIKIINQTKDTVLAESAEIAQTFVTRTKGLLGKQFLEKGGGVLIKPCRQVHSMWMKFNFDAVFLDKNNMVCHIQPEIKPGKISKFVRPARSVLELPSGTIMKTNTCVGDFIKIL